MTQTSLNLAVGFHSEIWAGAWGGSPMISNPRSPALLRSWAVVRRLSFRVAGFGQRPSLSRTTRYCLLSEITGNVIVSVSLLRIYGLSPA
jgi:hypothetical protein